MRRRFLWLAASLLVFAPGVVRGATLVERTVLVDVQADGTVRERERLIVEIEGPEDVREWSRFAVSLDENRRLVRIAASTVDRDGKARKVPERSIDTLEHAGPSELHSSRRLRIVEFPGLSRGSRLVVEWEVEERPWFPAGAVGLGTDASVRMARIEIRGPASLRWTVAGRSDLLREEPIAGGVAFTSEDLPARTTSDLGLDPVDAGPTILFAWDTSRTWGGVGDWFRDLAFPLLGVDGSVREVSERLGGSTADRREVLESLVRFTRREVRYVAVEVGIGGYRPSPPRETLGRRWGDCKDKSFLLIDLLGARGIRAYPALIRAGSAMPVAPGFASPAWFDHLIVAVPVADLEIRDDDPVSDGYLFVDPTQTEGSVSWLHSGVQGRRALVVSESGAELVSTPILPAAEGTQLSLDVVVGPEGDASGTMVATVSGRTASGIRRFLDQEREERADPELRNLLERWLPGVVVSNLSWTETESPIPRVELRGDVTIERLLQRTPQGGAIDLPDSPTVPVPRAFDDRLDAWVLDPSLDRREWRIDLRATGCRLETSRAGKENAFGSFAASVAPEADLFVVRRESEVRAIWAEPHDGEHLRDLSLLEHQTVKRRLRLDCG